MGYTLLGFLIGVAVSWFWLYKLSPARRFQHILSQETGKNSFDEQLQLCSSGWKNWRTVFTERRR